MRMWMVDPSKMCRKHLLGEHVECHMFLGVLRKGWNVQGYLDNNLFEPSSLFARHYVLFQEMFRRGYHHNSPMDISEVEALIMGLPNRTIFIAAAELDLIQRCTECRKLHDG